MPDAIRPISAPRIRVISARDMTPRERREYEHVKKQELAEDSKI
jgi:hypothetical protein